METIIYPLPDIAQNEDSHDKGIKNGCPCIVEIRGTWCCSLVGDFSQGTTPSASDLHNARATILYPFYNMEYKIINNIRQNKM